MCRNELTGHQCAGEVARNIEGYPFHLTFACTWHLQFRPKGKFLVHFLWLSYIPNPHVPQNAST